MRLPWIRSLALTAVLLGLGVTTSAKASTILLSDQNSTVSIDPYSSSGVNSWLVDGTDQLFQQWFWYRIGDTGGQSSIDTISAPTVNLLGSRLAEIAYSNDLLKVEVTYLLTGGSTGSLTSDLAETIRITNLSNGSLDLRFFQYSDFDLMGDADGDSVSMGPNVAGQSKLGFQMSETVVTPTPYAYEAALYNTTLTGFNSGTPYNLGNTATAGPGDATWAYQWNKTLARGGTLIISKDKHLQVVPEPSTLAIAGLGALTLIGFGIRRRRGN